MSILNTSDLMEKVVSCASATALFFNLPRSTAALRALGTKNGVRSRN